MVAALCFVSSMWEGPPCRDLIRGAHAPSRALFRRPRRKAPTPAPCPPSCAFPSRLPSAIRNPKSAIPDPPTPQFRNPQSAIRNPQSAIPFPSPLLSAWLPFGIAFAEKCNTIPGMPTVTVKLSKAEYARLQAAAAASRRTKSAVLREALKRPGRRSPSMLDAMRPYVGKLRGPADLSTNKSRMTGYGTSRSR